MNKVENVKNCPICNEYTYGDVAPHQCGKLCFIRMLDPMGVGVTNAPTMGCFAASKTDALGVYLRECPMTPEYLMRHSSALFEISTDDWTGISKVEFWGDGNGYNVLYTESSCRPHPYFEKMRKKHAEEFLQNVWGELDVSSETFAQILECMLKVPE